MSYRNAVVPVVLLAAGLALAGCGGDDRDTAQAATTTTTSSSRPTNSGSAAAPSFGSDADTQYLIRLAGSMNPDIVEKYSQQLLNLGHGICTDYERGVYIQDEARAVVAQLMTLPEYASYSESAQIDMLTIDLEARYFFCPSVTPRS